tara:strand:- start:3738 stop:4550 length:813 start_codon:yes stop_codon:yes gene_type:complete
MSYVIFGDGKVSNIIRSNSSRIITHKECDITDIDNVKEVFRGIDEDTVINCVAKTNLEECQVFKDEAYNVNVSGTKNLLSLSSDYKKKFVHISSGCLFDGNDVVSTEESSPTPAVWYTWTKKWADEYIQEYGYNNYLILRPRQLISSVSHPTNMITKFLRYTTFYGIDEPNSLTCIEDFKLMIDHLVNIDEMGIFNCCNAGVVSPYDIALNIKHYLKKELIVNKFSYEQLLEILPNKRVNTILSCDKLINTGFIPRDALKALHWCLENYK